MICYMITPEGEHHVSTHCIDECKEITTNYINLGISFELTIMETEDD